MLRFLVPLFCVVSCVNPIQAGPTAPVNAAERNETFAPESKTTTPTVSDPSQKRNQPETKRAQATVDKATAPMAGKQANIDKEPKDKTIVPKKPIASSQVQNPQSRVTVITGGPTLLRPQDHPVRSKAGTKFQSALDEARAVSAARAEKYRKEAKMEKVNEFVPNAAAPAETVRAGSETKSPQP